MKCTLKVKPLSINDNCPIKKRAYFDAIKKQLPNKVKLPKGKLMIVFNFYFSNPGQDWDSPIKHTQDAIFEAWNLQDAGIYKGIGDKHIVPKGQEKIEFELIPLRLFKMKEALKEYKKLIEFTLFATIGFFAREYFDIIRSIAQSGLGG